MVISDYGASANLFSFDLNADITDSWSYVRWVILFVMN